MKSFILMTSLLWLLVQNGKHEDHRGTDGLRVWTGRPMEGILEIRSTKVAEADLGVLQDCGGLGGLLRSDRLGRRHFERGRAASSSARRAAAHKVSYNCEKCGGNLLKFAMDFHAQIR